MKFHHIGLACLDLDREQACQALLGYAPESADFVDPAQGVRGRFLTGGGPRLELLAPLEGSDTLTPWLKNGARMYHQAYTTCDMHKTIEKLLTQRARLVREPLPAVAFSGRRVCFLMLPCMSLIELIEAE